MSDYMVGRKASGNKDRYVVGWNESKSNANAYKVGNSKSAPATAAKSVGGDQDPVVGSKSGFNYKENDYKDIGDKSANMNFGGQIKNGMKNLDASGPNGNLDLEYSEKGDWDVKADAMSRRKANMEAVKSYTGKSADYTSPTVDLVNIKK